MTSKRESRKIVASIVGLAHSLGLVTVAEGIETEQHADILLWLRCELGPGGSMERATGAEGILGLATAPSRGVSGALSNPRDGWAVSSLETLPTQFLARWRRSTRGPPVGLCFLDRDLRYLSLNQRLADINGSSVAAHIGKTVQQMTVEHRGRDGLCMSAVLSSCAG
jgi:hypothetical protein